MKVAPYSQDGPLAAWVCASGQPVVAVATQWAAMTWGWSWPIASLMYPATTTKARLKMKK